MLPIAQNEKCNLNSTKFDFNLEIELNSNSIKNKMGCKLLENVFKIFL